ncbi:MAG: methionine adenosyltransferase [Deltaproteobacteria bacterium]|nr:methionine adenosyltransferase [Deltaproteobacteria bacterium]
MIMSAYLFTSESVTEGHPDKVCDAVSDAILDQIIKADPQCRVACETLTKTGLIFIAGEITTSTYVHFPKIVRQTIKDIGYNDSSVGFDYETCSVISAIETQSPDIAVGVDKGENKEQGAGDQGMMFGYACRETPELMPLPIIKAHQLVKRLALVRKENIIPFLRPDGKSQVTVKYDNNKPVGIDNIVISSQHKDTVQMHQLREAIIEEVIKKVFAPDEIPQQSENIKINPTGRFVMGGPMADAGLTGRKIIVDTYGGMAAHGGGAFSGKDPSKVDRSASYMARYIAKNIVKAGIANRLQVQLSYAIGVAQPVSILAQSFGTGKVEDNKIEQIIRNNFDCRPAAIIKKLDLLKPRYLITSSYGHFGRSEPEFTWEKTDMAEQLKSEI